MLNLDGYKIYSSKYIGSTFDEYLKHINDSKHKCKIIDGNFLGTTTFSFIKPSFLSYSPSYCPNIEYIYINDEPIKTKLDENYIKKIKNKRKNLQRTLERANKKQKRLEFINSDKKCIICKIIKKFDKFSKHENIKPNPRCQLCVTHKRKFCNKCESPIRKQYFNDENNMCIDCLMINNDDEKESNN